MTTHTQTWKGCIHCKDKRRKKHVNNMWVMQSVFTIWYLPKVALIPRLGRSLHAALTRPVDAYSISNMSDP